MAGLLDLLRRAAPGEAPQDVMAGSVMSPSYIPETSGRQLALGGVRGLLDWSPVGLIDAATTAINKANVPSLALTRAVFGRQKLPGDAAVGLLGQGGGAGYDAARMAAGAAVPMMGLLGNQAGGALPRGYARDQSGAIVWHGSPHTFQPEPGAPLGKFRADKIGTGEGAQAYGHGLYVAESPDVATSYKNLVQRDPGRLTVDGKVVQPDTMYGRAAEDVARIGLKAALQKIDDNIRFNEKYAPDMAALYKDLRTKVEALDPKRVGLKKGQLYKVDLPDDAIARMLDWDKPLSRQPEAVRRFFEPQVDPVRSALAKPGAPGWGEFSAPQAYDPLGAELLQLLGHSNRMDASTVLSGGTGGPLSAARLHAAGIPGIRYLDAGSRGAGAGTSNYVVFPGNEGLLKILGRE